MNSFSHRNELVFCENWVKPSQYWSRSWNMTERQPDCDGMTPNWPASSCATMISSILAVTLWNGKLLKVVSFSRILRDGSRLWSAEDVKAIVEDFGIVMNIRSRFALRTRLLWPLFMSLSSIFSFSYGSNPIEKLRRQYLRLDKCFMVTDRACPHQMSSTLLREAIEDGTSVEETFCEHNWVKILISAQVESVHRRCCWLHSRTNDDCTRLLPRMIVWRRKAKNKTGHCLVTIKNRK